MTHSGERVHFPTIPDARGTLVVAEEHQLKFRIGSVGWANHASLTGSTGEGFEHDEAVVTALAGSLEVVVGSVNDVARIRLDRRDSGWHVPAGLPWAIENPSADAVSLVIATAHNSTGPKPDVLTAPTGISLPADDRAGWKMTWVNSNRQVPFRIRRAYYLHGVPAGATRGGHAHRELEQVIVSVSGSFELVLHDGQHRTAMTLDRPDVGVYIPTGIWRELTSFSPGAVCVVLASLPYSERDYIWDFDQFGREVRAGQWALTRDDGGESGGVSHQR